jgi:hypothetical protein
MGTNYDGPCPKPTEEEEDIFLPNMYCRALYGRDDPAFWARTHMVENSWLVFRYRGAASIDCPVIAAALLS